MASTWSGIIATTRHILATSIGDRPPTTTSLVVGYVLLGLDSLRNISWLVLLMVIRLVLTHPTLEVLLLGSLLLCLRSRLMVQVGGWGWKELTSGLGLVLNLDWLLYQPRSSLWTHYRHPRYYTLGL